MHLIGNFPVVHDYLHPRIECSTRGICLVLVTAEEPLARLYVSPDEAKQIALALTEAAAHVEAAMRATKESQP